MGVQRARDAYALMKDGVIKGMSIGFRAIKDEWKAGARHLKELRLHEVSLVTFPANQHALISSVKLTAPGAARAAEERPLSWEDWLRSGTREVDVDAPPVPDVPFDWGPYFEAERRRPVDDLLDTMRRATE